MQVSRMYVRKNIQQMVGYVGGEQPEDKGVIKLNTNENPYPPSQRVQDALHALDFAALRKYPPPTSAPLCDVIANLHHLDVRAGYGY